MQKIHQYLCKMYAKVRSPPSVSSFHVMRYSALCKFSFFQKYESTNFQNGFFCGFLPYHY